MADRTTDKDDAASAADITPAKKPYAAPVVVHWGTFRDVTRSNSHSSAKDGKHSQGTA